MKIENTKIYVHTQFISNLVQKKLFELNCNWDYGVKEIKNFTGWIYISEHKRLMIFVNDHYVKTEYKILPIKALNLNPSWCIAVYTLAVTQREILSKVLKRTHEGFFGCTYFGVLNGNNYICDGRIPDVQEISWDEFDHLYLPIETEKETEKEMKKQFLTRDQLVSLLNISSCKSWEETIQNILNKDPYTLGNYKYEIPQKAITLLNEKGTQFQKETVKLMGIELEEDLSVNVCSNRLDDYIVKRIEGKYKFKSFFLDSIYDWKIEKDDENVLCLIPTKKKK